MPSILIKVPKGAFPVAARANLVRHVIEAAAEAEQIPADPKMRALCWIVIDEAEEGMWTIGGVDMSAQVLPCFAMIHVPAGVLDETARTLYVKLIHEAFAQSVPVSEKRRVASSVIVSDVVDGTWGGSGAILTLPMLARAAGYKHLQHLVAGA